MKSFDKSIRTLVATAGGNGNLLFNVGPMPDGRIEPRQVARHADMGAWGASTRRGNRVYIHAFAWNGDTLRLPAFSARVVSARRLTGEPVELAQDASGITRRVPPAQQDPADTPIVLDIDRPAMALTPVPVPPVKGR